MSAGRLAAPLPWATLAVHRYIIPFWNWVDPRIEILLLIFFCAGCLISPSQEGHSTVSGKGKYKCKPATSQLHSTKKPVTTMLTYPWKCTVLHCNHLGNTWKPLVLMTQHFDYCLSASEGDNQSVRSSAPVVSRCFPGGYNVKLYISRGRLAYWLLAFLHSVV